jgi:hypothetical protein
MTDRGRPRITKPGPFPVVGGTLAVFFVVMTLLAFQLRAGADPAIGAGEPQRDAASPAPRIVIRRRVVVTRIVEHRRRRASTPTAGAGSAPAPPAAAAPAPPAAPAPAPLTTRSS